MAILPGDIIRLSADSDLLCNVIFGVFTNQKCVAIIDDIFRQRMICVWSFISSVYPAFVLPIIACECRSVHLEGILNSILIPIAVSGVYHPMFKTLLALGHQLGGVLAKWEDRASCTTICL